MYLCKNMEHGTIHGEATHDGLCKKHDEWIQLGVFMAVHASGATNAKQTDGELGKVIGSASMKSVCTVQYQAKL